MSFRVISRSLIGASILAAVNSFIHAAERPWTPGDSIGVRYAASNVDEPQSWIEPSPQAWARSVGRSKQGVVPSPDGQYFLWINYNNDLQIDRPRTTLQIFRTQTVRAAIRSWHHQSEAPRPAAEVTFVGSPIGASGLRSPRWDPDSRAVFFRALTDQQRYEVFKLNIESGVVDQMTFSPHGVDTYAFRDGRQMYGRYWTLQWPAARNYPVEAVSRAADGSASQPSLLRLHADGEFFTSYGPHGSRMSIDPFIQAAVAPDGRLAVTLQYNPRSQLTEFVLLRFEGERPPQVLLTAVASPISAMVSRIFWSADGRNVVLVGVREPSGERAGTSTKLPSISALRISNLAWERLDSLPNGNVESVDWSESLGRLTIGRRDGDGKAERRVYQLKADHWSNSLAYDTASNKSPLGALAVEIRQDANTPPLLVAREGERQISLSLPDPALVGVRLTKTIPFKWRDYDGHQREGALLLPHTRKPNQPVPIVIQPYYYIPELFLPDGVNRTSDASQALAARGIAVLSIETDDLVPIQKVTDPRSPPPEGPQTIRRIDAVVDALIEQGIATPTKVAMSGFSRGGYQTLYTITHPARTRLAAAVVADSYTGSYPAYLERLAIRATGARGFLAQGHKFWDEPMYWLEHDVTFNVDRVSTPVLFSESSNPAVPDTEYSSGSLQMMGAFSLNAKPFEYLYFRDGAHQLALPLQRAAMMNAVVDWMAFWLLDEEDPDPAKAIQNQRWRKLRADRALQNSKEGLPEEGGFIKTRSGLVYAITKRKQGQAARPGDLVSVHYVGIRTDGTEFVNTYKGGVPLQMRLGAAPSSSEMLLARRNDGVFDPQVGNGWDEALALLHVGEKATFIMPRELALAEKRVAPEGVPADSRVRYDVELTNVVPNSSGQIDGSSAEVREVLREMADAGVGDVASNFRKLNALAYRALYEMDDVSSALRYFRWNIVLFPNQPDLYDSLAEGYLQAGDREQAIENYNRALRLNPGIKSDAKSIVARLQDDPKSLQTLRRQLRDAYQRTIDRRSPKH